MSLQKKLEAAQKEGYKKGVEAAMSKIQKEIEAAFLQGVQVGADASNEIWTKAMQNAPGIGPKTIEKIYNQAKNEQSIIKEERRRLQQQAV